MKMLKTLFVFAGLALATIATPTVAQAQEWIAIAVNDHGWGFSSGRSEENARSRAIDACENRTGYSCHYQTVSVPRRDWYLVAIACDNGPNSVGASRFGYDAAAQVAANKISGCWSYSTMTRRG